MATLTHVNVGTIFDLLKMRLPDGSALTKILNALAERDDFAKYVPSFPANQGLTHHDLRTINLPTGYLVDIGGSWKTSKSEREPIVEALLTIKSSYQAPTDIFEQYEKAVAIALIQSEKIAHVMAINQGLNNIILHGSTLPNQSGIIGLENRAPYTTYDSKFTFNVGGSGNDLRSCWLMKPGIDTLHKLYNKNHPTLGVSMKDKGEHLIQGLGTAADEHRYDILIEFKIQNGIFVRDQRALKRICNVPCGVTDQPGADLITQIIEASIINAPTGGTMQVKDAEGRITDTPAPWLLMCDERLYAKLVVGANSKLMVYTSEANIYQTKLPMIGHNIIVLRWDALNRDLSQGETKLLKAS